MEKTDITDSWYASWFDTPYYHILYRDRNEEEARSFIRNLVADLKVVKGSDVLDLACGRGRHSQQLAQLGYKVTGVDLSAESIAFAKTNIPTSLPDVSSLEFRVHNMTKALPENYDLIVNLFTSFGYFEREEDNLHTIEAMRDTLKPNGVAVIDFLNVPFVVSHLVPSDQKTVDGITFHQQRVYRDGYIYKNIRFSVDDYPYNYTERVRALKLEDFSKLLDTADLKLLNLYGDYDLNAYDRDTSPRLIMAFSR